MPLSNMQQQQGSSTGVSQSSDYNPKLVYATKQNHHQDPVELIFAVQNPQTGSEETVKCYLTQQDVAQIFESTQEGQQWLNSNKQQGIRSIRSRAA
jgi:hypothetical protein